MKVSVIIPSYNHSKYLRQRINSILNQTYKDFELIILDDCSNDGSKEIIDEYLDKFPGIIAIYNKSNSGSPFSQWNLGVSLAKGDFLWIAESDDSADPLFLEKTSSVLIQNEKAGFVHSDSLVVDEQNKKEFLTSDLKKVHVTNHNNNSLNGKTEILNNFFVENPIMNVSSVLFRKDKYFEAGGADATMKYCGDWLLYIKILLISDLAYVPLPLNVFRLHSRSTYHNYYKSNIYLAEKVRIYRLILDNLNIPFGKYILMVYKILKGVILRIIYTFGFLN